MVRLIDGIWVRRWFGDYSAHTNLLSAIIGIHSPSYAMFDSESLKRVWAAKSFGVYWIDPKEQKYK